MAYLEELLPEFRKGAKIRCSDWDKKRFIHYNGYVIRDENHYPIFKEVSDWTDVLLSDKWELYQEPEPDWQYIIDNKCLCAFWNKKGCEVLGFLKQIRYYKDNDFYTYISLPGAIYTKCCPVRRDEVTFYDDKKDD